MPSGVRNGRWCIECHIERQKASTLGAVRRVAKENGGRCISNVYSDAGCKLLFECPKGHQWWSNPSLIKTGRAWCRICALESRREAKLDELSGIAKDRGGKCLSTRYTCNYHKLLWECESGHQWWATPSSIKHSRTWCPTCSSSHCESTCRRMLEALFECEFPTMYPDWLIGVNGHRLELDGYCEGLGLAFEYQGIQHSKHSEFFHSSVKDFENQQRNDAKKAELCKDKGITLMEIRPDKPNVSNEIIYTLIMEECARLQIAIPNPCDINEIDLQGLYSRPLFRSTKGR